MRSWFLDLFVQTSDAYVLRALLKYVSTRLAKFDGRFNDLCRHCGTGDPSCSSRNKTQHLPYNSSLY